MGVSQRGGGGLLGPQFRLETGRPLEIRVLVGEVHRALKSVGVDPAGISGHSFRVGAATEAALQGSSDASIMKLGRWKSGAFRRYITKGESEEASNCRLLAKAGTKTGDGLGWGGGGGLGDM